jgi:subtilase family serine protease
VIVLPLPEKKRGGNFSPAYPGSGVGGGYSPADIQSAYNVSASGGKGQTVAIVVAYDYPSAEADLATYRAEYGLAACTAANGCFRKVDQNGYVSYPSTPPEGTLWNIEAALDMDMVSATCPDC